MHAKVHWNLLSIRLAINDLYLVVISIGCMWASLIREAWFF